MAKGPARLLAWGFGKARAPTSSRLGHPGTGEAQDLTSIRQLCKGPYEGVGVAGGDIEPIQVAALLHQILGHPQGKRLAKPGYHVP